MTHAHHSITAVPDLNGRYDIYGAIHKGLRKAGCELLVRLGSTDFEEAEQIEEVLALLRTYLMLAASHVGHEDDHIHAALAARGVATDTVDHQHDDHRDAFAKLEGLARAVETAWPLHRRATGRRLYLAFAAYMAEDFAHMHEEETVTAPALWRSFTDDELHAIEMAIVSSLTPEKNMAFMRIMVPAMNPQERAAMLGAMQKAAPPEIFDAVIEFAVRPALTARAFGDLAGRLQLAA
jgi:DNA-directed RNA polymerase specialized sigma24 family protein